MGQFKSIKLIFCKFKCQYDLENHGQDHQFSNTSEIVNVKYWHFSKVSGK